ncbi:PIN domain-containing protein [Comamonas thiooxydans]|uniref:PIN domain-containing protein n=1 Tax=Comamonas thiooxydans TaxID=363952 RepID=UPI00263AEB4D|nr:PIN domain-containing protein [Comamonas thiooxydans]
MLDTCVLLDVVRDITRQEVMAHNMQAAKVMLQAAEARSELVVLMAAQVSNELQENLPMVESAAQASLAKLLAQIKRVDEVAAEFGAVGSVRTSHLVDHVPRARATMDNWVRVSVPVTPSDAVASKAMHRVVHAIAPSRKGKESTKDCLVIETYLEAAAQLRSAGFTNKIVFGSSNTNDYLDSVTRQVPTQLASEFATCGMDYGSNFGSMKHLLGL